MIATFLPLLSLCIFVIYRWGERLRGMRGKCPLVGILKNRVKWSFAYWPLTEPLIKDFWDMLFQLFKQEDSDTCVYVAHMSWHLETVTWVDNWNQWELWNYIYTGTHARRSVNQLEPQPREDRAALGITRSGRAVIPWPRSRRSAKWGHE